MLRMDRGFIIRHKVLMERCSILFAYHEMGISRNTVSNLETSEPVVGDMTKKFPPVMERSSKIKHLQS